MLFFFFYYLKKNIVVVFSCFFDVTMFYFSFVMFPESLFWTVADKTRLSELFFNLFYELIF